MNRKVFISMLILAISFLVGLYIAKIFFPQEFVMAIQNEQLIAIGNFIDTHKWLYYICGGLTSFATYWLYLCAVSHRRYLKWWECLIIAVYIVIAKIIGTFDINIATAISIASFVVFPIITKGNLKSCGIVYSTHLIAQALSLSIRNLKLYLATTNFITMALMSIDMYLWLFLFYVVFNYKADKEIC